MRLRILVPAAPGRLGNVDLIGQPGDDVETIGRHMRVQERLRCRVTGVDLVEDTGRMLQPVRELGAADLHGGDGVGIHV